MAFNEGRYTRSMDKARKTSNPMADALTRAAEALADSPLPDSGVHEARKMLKKARAGLRLHRAAFSKADYRRHNTELRDAGRLLSPLRDARTRGELVQNMRD